MKRSLAFVIALVLLAVIVAPALALVSGSPTQDAWVEVANPTNTNNTADLWVRASTVSCTPDRVSYLQYDLTGLTAAQMGWATLVVRINGITGDFSTPRNVTLYRLLNDNWTETNVTWNSVNPGTTPGAGPNIGAKIQAIPVSAALTTITFNDPALLAYFKEKAGGKISFALEMTDNCTAGSTGVRIDSAEFVTGGSAPTLDLRTAGPPPTAVEVSTASAQRTAWPLYAGLGVVALGVVAGVVISRRKAA